MSKEAKYTPGPWWVEPPDRGNRWSIMQGEAEHDVGEVACTYGQSNARLIAAAPDLLEACELVSMFYAANPHLLQSDPRVRVYVEACRGAVTKARGQ